MRKVNGERLQIEAAAFAVARRRGCVDMEK